MKIHESFLFLHIIVKRYKEEIQFFKKDVRGICAKNDYNSIFWKKGSLRRCYDLKNLKIVLILASDANLDRTQFF